MSGFERLLEPGCTERPTCRCGQEMEVARIERLPEGTDADVRVYYCAACQHEMRLTVWAAVVEARWVGVTTAVNHETCL
jgi:hypothetical protein